MFLPYTKTALRVLLVSVVGLLELALLASVPAQAAHVNPALVQWGCATNEAYNDPEFGCPSEVDLVTGPWLLDGWKPWHSTWLNKFSEPQNAGKTPYILSYMIAGLGRRDIGMTDCDLNDNVLSVCTDGADYIRNNSASIEAEYRRTADQIAAIYGSREVYIHMEPDFFLYHQSSLQKNPLTRTEAHRFMNKLIAIYRNRLPGAKIAMDVSMWNPDLPGWHAGFVGADYGAMVGKAFPGNKLVDGKTYEQVQSAVGAPLIVDTAHTFGGYFTAYDASWEVDNHGVHAVIQAPTNNARYASFLSSLDSGEVVTEPEAPVADPIPDGVPVIDQTIYEMRPILDPPDLELLEEVAP